MFECLIEPTFQVPLKAISTQIQTFASQASSLDSKLELSAMLNLQKYQPPPTHTGLKLNLTLGNLFTRNEK